MRGLITRAASIVLLEGVATFDSVTGDFTSFEIVKLAGPRPDACSAIVTAVS
ncbi:MAG: hypothetical protein ACXVRU_07695 [Gaiellaceae bacterium]